jgi:hypothetical protein
MTTARQTSQRAIEPEDYLSEQAVLAKWPMLTAKELKKARKYKAIEFYAFRSGPCYTAEQVQLYIDQTYLQQGEPCEAPEDRPLPSLPSPPSGQQMSHSSSTASISTAHIQNAAVLSMPAGMTPELAASAAELLRQRTGKTPRSGSRRSSFQRPPQPTAASLVLIK